MMRSASAVVATLALAFSAHGATFTVNNANDSGAGSLRWAIEQANATPGKDLIWGSVTPVIRLASPLPSITESVDMAANVRIDGAGAGSADGLAIRASGVTVRYMELINFSGDGVVVAGDDNILDFVSATNDRNGVVIGGSRNTLTAVWANKNRENGFWITTAASKNQIGKLMPMILCPMVPSEVAASGNGAAGIRVDGEANVIDGSIFGSDGSGGPNGGDGVVIAGPNNSVINSHFSGNRRSGAVLLAPATFSNNTGGCNAGPFLDGALLAPPTLTSAVADLTAGTVTGTFRGRAGTRYTIELMSNATSADCPQGLLSNIGTRSVMTDAAGNAAFKTVVYPPSAAVTAIAIGPDGVSRLSTVAAARQTGENRSDLTVTMNGPDSAAHDQVIELTIRVSNDGPAAITGPHIEIPAVQGTIALASEPSSGTCSREGVRTACNVGALAAGESATIVHRVSIAAFSGTLAFEVSGANNGATDPNTANNAASKNVVLGGARHRAAR